VSGELIAERYELRGLVGSGGMSSVYRAHDTLLERDVALKILHSHYSADAEYSERFRREARAVARLSHPGIVTVIDRGEADGRQFIVFELVGGENLKELVEREGPLPVRRALEIGLEVADALAFAHRRGIVHRDVKPQNVLVNGEGTLKVTDFGIARSLDVEHGMTQTGTVLGTSNYIAPEQASGESVGPQTDVYSLGVVLFELLAGRVPFEGESFVQIAMRHINEPPPSLAGLRPDVPPRVAATVERALAKDPRDRFPSMDAFAAELRACLAETAVDAARDAQPTVVVPPARPARRGARPRPAPRPPRARWPLVAGGAAAVAAGVAAALVLGLLHDGGSGSPPPAGNRPVRLVGLNAYDPYGDGTEHGDQARYATDGNTATSWPTEHYDAGLGKRGVGLVLDAGAARAISRITVSSGTPGFTARIRAGDSPGGGFRTVSGTRTVTGTTAFPIRSGTKARYWLVWITSLGPNPSVRIDEVTARS
jgi:eukaryotic-like serine/threonine-protein kinase